MFRLACTRRDVLLLAADDAADEALQTALVAG